MSKKNRKHPRGETLIEAMVSLAVLSIGLIGILQMNGFATSQLGVARKETQAANIARDLVDAFERLPYEHPALAPSGVALGAPFVDMDNSTGLQSLGTPFAGRPLLGAAVAAVSSDVTDTSMEVRWRVAEQGSLKMIAVMVRYAGGPTGRRQLTFWTTKAEIADVLGGNRGGVPEI